MSRARYEPQIACVDHNGFLQRGVFYGALSFAFQPEVKYTEGPGDSVSKAGGRSSVVGLRSYPMSDHLRTSIGSQPASHFTCAGEKGWTRGGL